MSKLIPVTFTKAWRGYSANETAGFSAEQAEGLISSGTAVAAGQPAGKPKQAAVKAAISAPAAEPVAPVPADDEKP